MEDWEHSGKMIFRGRTNLPQITEKLKSKKHYTLFYYKVFHNCLPYKVEQYSFKTNKLKTVYWFDKYAINTKIRKHSSAKYIDCNKTYQQKEKFKVNTEVCSDNTKQITVFDGWTWKYTNYYKNNKLYKKDIYQNGKVYNKINGKLVFTGEYYEIDNDPLHIPKLDDYPWCDNSIKK